LGVAQLLESIREQNDAGLIDQGKKEMEELEPGAVPSGPEDDGQFTLAEEIKRQMRREEKKKRKEEEFKIAASTCTRFTRQGTRWLLTVPFHFLQISPQIILTPLGTHTRRSLQPVWLVPFPAFSFSPVGRPCWMLCFHRCEG
jgi:hypothetical protein